MTEPNLDNTVKALVTEAIFKAIDEKKREELMRTAIASLLEKDSGLYGRGLSPLHDCFNHAARQVAMDIVREKIIKDENFKTQIASIVTQAMERIWSTDKREEIVMNIANGIVEAMRPKER